VRGQAAACLAQSAGRDTVDKLQTASCLLTAAVARRLDSSHAHALCTLALTLAKRELAILAPVQAAAEGRLDGLAAALADESVPNVRHVAITILTYHLHLLGTLSGGDAAAAIVAEVWPS
jgi:hypothetical protein